MASSSVSKPMIDSTGPNTSSRAIRMRVVDVGEDRRLDELAAGRSQRPRPACRRVGSARPPPWRYRYSRGSSWYCGGVVTGPILVSGFMGSPILRGARELQRGVSTNLSLDRVLHEQPRAGDAGLACRREDAGDRAGRGGVEVGSPRTRCWATCRRVRARRASGCAPPSHRSCAGRIRAGEGDLGDAGMVDQRRCRSPGRSR